MTQGDPPIQELLDLWGIKLGSINVRSLYRSIDDIGVFLRRSKFHVLCIQETFLNASITDVEIEVPGYTCFRHDRTEGSGKSMGGGLVIYCSTTYEFEHMTPQNVCTPDIDLQCVTLK